MNLQLRASSAGIAALLATACAVPTGTAGEANDLTATASKRVIQPGTTFCAATTSPSNARHNTFAYVYPENLSRAARNPETDMFVVVQLTTTRPDKTTPGLWLVDNFTSDQGEKISWSRGKSDWLADFWGEKPDLARCVTATAETPAGNSLVLGNECLGGASRNQNVALFHTSPPNVAGAFKLAIDTPPDQGTAVASRPLGVGPVNAAVLRADKPSRECGLPFDRAAARAGINPWSLLKWFDFIATKIDRGLYWSLLAGKHELKPFGFGQASMGDIGRGEHGQTYRRTFTVPGETAPSACLDVDEFLGPRNSPGLVKLASLSDCNGNVSFTISLDHDEFGQYPGEREQRNASWTIFDPSGQPVATYRPLERLTERTALGANHTYVLRDARWWNVTLAETWEHGTKSMFFREYFNQYALLPGSPTRGMTQAQLALAILVMGYE